MNEFGLALLWLMGQISVLCLVTMPVLSAGSSRTSSDQTLWRHLRHCC